MEPSESLTKQLAQLYGISESNLQWACIGTFAVMATAFVTAVMAFVTKRMADETKNMAGATQTYVGIQERIYAVSHRPWVIPARLRFEDGSRALERNFVLELLNTTPVVANRVSVNVDMWFRYAEPIAAYGTDTRRVPCANEFGPIPVPPNEPTVMTWLLPQDVVANWLHNVLGSISLAECHVFVKTRYCSMNGEASGNYTYYRHHRGRGFVLLAYADITSEADATSSNGWG